MDIFNYSFLSFVSAKNPVLQLDVRMGVRDEGDGEDDWKHLASSVEDRNLQCTLVSMIWLAKSNTEISH